MFHIKNQNIPLRYINELTGVNYFKVKKLLQPETFAVSWFLGIPGKVNSTKFVNHVKFIPAKFSKSLSTKVKSSKFFTSVEILLISCEDTCRGCMQSYR